MSAHQRSKHPIWLRAAQAFLIAIGLVLVATGRVAAGIFLIAFPVLATLAGRLIASIPGVRPIMEKRFQLGVQYDRTGTIWRLELRDEDGQEVTVAHDQVRGLTLDEAFELLKHDLDAYIRSPEH